MSVHSFLRGRILLHLSKDWRFAVHSCVRGKIPEHLLEGWWFRCIHVSGAGYRCIYLRSDDLRCIQVFGVRFRCTCLRDDDVGAFMCEGQDFSAFTWGMMISGHSCLMGRISVHLLEDWTFRCIHVWGARFRCIYLRDDDFGAFICEE